MGDNIWQNVFQEIFKKNLELMKQEPEAAGLNALFDRAGAYEQLTIGEVRLKTGRIEIGDPLCYINTKYSCTLEETVEPGSHEQPFYRCVRADDGHWCICFCHIFINFYFCLSKENERWYNDSKFTVKQRRSNNEMDDCIRYTWFRILLREDA